MLQSIKIWMEMTSTKFNIIVSSWDGKKRMRSSRRNKDCNYFCNDFFSFFTILSKYSMVNVNIRQRQVVTSALREGNVPHSSTHEWKIPWMEEPGGLQSVGSLSVWHDWVTPLSLSTFMHWRRKWQPAPVFLPGEFQGWRSLVGCRLWGRTESDTTEAT